MKLFESETVELQEIYTPELKKQIVAFANTNGGTIYIGVRDSGEIVGLHNADFVMQQISSTIRDGIRPDLAMFTNLELLNEDEKFFIKIMVNQGTKKPYYLSDKGLKPTGMYVRNGTSSAPASEDAIRMMIKMTDGDSFETNRSMNQDLTFNQLNNEMQKKGLELSKIQMRNLGILSADNIYTNMGLLVSDQCKHSIKFAIFQGTDKLVFRDRTEFTGSVFTQLNDAYKAIDFYNGTKATFQDLLRTDHRDYPKDAIREALLNAIVHREYAFSGSTFINLYSDLAKYYLAGAILLGAAPCTAMVFVWSHLTKGNAAYTVVQVATNDLIILVAFTPIVAFLLGVSGVRIPWDTLILSVVLFVVIPLAGGVITRNYITKKRGYEYLKKNFIPKFGNITIIGLLLTLIIIFSFQGDVILNNPLHIVLIAIPLIIQTFLIFFIAYTASKALKLPHNIAAPAGMIGASNFFELAVAVAIALFGTQSPVALATIVGVLVEVPVMLILVKVANNTKHWFLKPDAK